MNRPFMCYLAGYISDVKALECAEWRLKIKNFFNMKPKWHGQLCFIDPMNGESVASLGKEGLTSCFPPHAIVHRDYNSVLASDLIIANPNTFGEPREPIGTICEMAWAFQLRKPIILISDNYRYINHPFTSYFASAIVKDTDELLKGNLIQQFYKGLANG